MAAMILLSLVEVVIVMAVVVVCAIVMQTVMWCGEGSCVDHGDFGGRSGHDGCACGSSSGHFGERW
jgi:hypothetical protein